LGSVVAVREKALGRPVPPGRNVLGVGLFAEEALAAAEVGQLDQFAAHQDVLWLDVTVEDAVLVHVLYRLQQLEHEELDDSCLQVLFAALDVFVHVALHQLENQGETARGLVTGN